MNRCVHAWLKMRFTHCAALLLFGLPLAAQSIPDCFIQLFQATATGTSGNFDNRNSGCTTWTVTYNLQGFTSPSVQLESAPDAANNLPGTFVAFAGTVVTGSNPNTTSPQSSMSFSGYYPWIRLNVTALTGSGTITVLAYGYKPQAVTSGGSSGPTANVNLAQVGGTSTVAGGVSGSQGVGGLAANGAALAGNPVLIAGSDGTDARNISTDASGRPQVNVVQIGGSTVVTDPCQQATRTVGVINLTSSGRIIVGTAAKQSYVCFLQFSISAAADNIALVEGTGSTCGSSTAGMAGGATAATGWNLLANGSVTAGGFVYYAFKTATLADDVCLLASSAAQISGVVQYVQQ